MKQKYNIEWLIDKYENGENFKFLYFCGHTNKYHEIIGKFCLSQWYKSSFTVNGVIYKTSEHWMMANKALLFNDKECFEKIIISEEAKEAKDLGRSVKNYNEETWDELKFEIVKTGNIHKFNQNRDLGEYLLQSENKVIVEASPMDAIWGIGLSQDSQYINNLYAWRGLNLLGFALMETRDFLNEFGYFTELQNSVYPPWVQFPEVVSSDMFWRMGKGEDFIKQFSIYYDALSEKEKIIYKLSNPAPQQWHTFYD